MASAKKQCPTCKGKGTISGKGAAERISSGEDEKREYRTRVNYKKAIMESPVRNARISTRPLNYDLQDEPRSKGNKVGKALSK